MNKAYKFTIASGESRIVTFDVGVSEIALQNANGEDGASKISKLKDISIENVENNQLLVYNSETEKWENKNQLNAGEGLIIENGTIQVNPYTYSTTAKKTAEKWIDESVIYAKVIPVDALPNATTKQVAHNITDLANLIDHFSTAKDANNVRIKFDKLITSVDNTNINITSDTDLSGYSGNVTLRFTKKAIYIPLVKGTSYAYYSPYPFFNSVTPYEDCYAMYVDGGLYGSNHGLIVFDKNINPAISFESNGYVERAGTSQSVTYNGHTMYYTFVNQNTGCLTAVSTAYSNGTLAGYANPTLAIQALIDELYE